MDVILRWQGGEDPEGGPTRFTLHLDISPELESPTLEIESDILEREFDPEGELARGTTYYWRITAADSLAATRVSPVYSFTTGPNRAPLAPTAPEPADDALGIPISPELRWSASADPDGDRVTYHVYLDPATPPALLLGSTAETRIAAGTLGYTRTYYWQVIAEDAYGRRTPGAVWRFATEAAPNHPPAAPALPSPDDGRGRSVGELGSRLGRGPRSRRRPGRLRSLLRDHGSAALRAPALRDFLRSTGKSGV